MSETRTGTQVLILNVRVLRAVRNIYIRRREKFPYSYVMDKTGRVSYPTHKSPRVCATTCYSVVQLLVCWDGIKMMYFLSVLMLLWLVVSHVVVGVNVDTVATSPVTPTTS